MMSLEGMPVCQKGLATKDNGYDRSRGRHYLSLSPDERTVSAPVIHLILTGSTVCAYTHRYEGHAALVYPQVACDSNA
ncbi:hypothetical protein [Sulfoacidibacillus ferrooxidans]|uniref:Uncharacterized protein n=1 Tax=Sulfoacidibacillus ferrooxidans TaxID=2005001 RepID=A0A9X1VAZ2_9BACL|nr:hypothetical protein [Sulfoacidibacillus ferrooxidans]MCI0184514.1 hypothetical protein [Sulfoacidibacillus ferrooxidans]